MSNPLPVTQATAGMGVAAVTTSLAVPVADMLQEQGCLSGPLRAADAFTIVVARGPNNVIVARYGARGDRMAWSGSDLPAVRRHLTAALEALRNVGGADPS